MAGDECRARSAPVFRSSFRRPGKHTEYFFAHADHLTSLSNGHPAMAGKAHVPSIIREEIEVELLHAFENFPTTQTRKPMPGDEVRR
jgi:hypothetical protein